MLSEEEIGSITSGSKLQLRVLFLTLIYISSVHQLKRARSYAEETTGTSKLTQTVISIIQRCRSFPNVILIPTQSAHKNRKTYNPTI